MVKESSNCNIPPLQSVDGTWALTATAKAELLAKAFQDKFVLADGPDDSASLNQEVFESGFVLIRSRWTFKLLSKLSENSSTGPDGIPTQILKQCARELAYPLTKLIRLIVSSGKWPELW